MNRASPFTLAATLSMAVLATPHAANAQAVQQYTYQPDRIYPVRTGLGITTQIERSPN